MYCMHKIMLIYDIPMTCALKTVAVMQGHYGGNSCTCHGLCTLVLRRQVLVYIYMRKLLSLILLGEKHIFISLNLGCILCYLAL